MGGVEEEENGERRDEECEKPAEGGERRKLSPRRVGDLSPSPSPSPSLIRREGGNEEGK